MDLGCRKSMWKKYAYMYLHTFFLTICSYIMKETLSYQLPTSKCVGFLQKFAPTTVGAIQKKETLPIYGNGDVLSHY